MPNLGEILNGLIDDFKSSLSRRKSNYAVAGDDSLENLMKATDAGSDPGAAGSIAGSLYGGNLTGAQIQANQFAANESALAFRREIAADASKHQREVADLKAAGLNPMLATGMSGGTVHSSPAAPVSPGTPALNLGSILSLAFQEKQLQIQSKLADADIRLKDSEAANLNERTTSQQIQNWIQEHTKELQVESARLENDLKEGKIRLTESQILETEEKVKLIINQQDTELAKKGAFLAEAVLKNAQASQIVQLLPYQKALMSAQTENQKAAAALSWAHAAYQNGLIDNGYLDSFCREAFASANVAESEAAITGVKAAIQSGDYSHSAIGYVPVISEMSTGLANAFGVIGNVFHGIIK